MTDTELQEILARAAQLARRYTLDELDTDTIYAVEEDVRALAAECKRLREVEAAARNYICCTTNPRLSPYVSKNGRHGKSPWAELIDAVDAAQGPPS
jgi:hypothetical protein